LSSYVANHNLTAESQSGAKDQFCCAAYNITLDLNWEAWRVSKNLKKNHRR
jgi:hypothetical protein